MRRAGHRGLVRSAIVAAGNAGDPALGDALLLHAEGPDPVLAEHARWALAKLERRDSPGQE
jgi:epoxyqueuosine reductase